MQVMKLIEKAHAASFDFENCADQFHVFFGLALNAHGRFEDLTHSPAHISFDGLIKHRFRVEPGETGHNGIDQKLNSRMLPSSFQDRVDRGADRAAMGVPHDYKQWCAQMASGILQASRDFR